MATAPKTTSGTSSEEARKQNNKQAKNAARRKYEYPPDNYEAPLGMLRVHSEEYYSIRSAGRVLHEWTLCEKPRAEPNNGCRMGRFGFFVWYQGVLRKAIWVTRGACDYVSPGEEGDEHEVDDDEGEFEELMEGV